MHAMFLIPVYVNAQIFSELFEFDVSGSREILQAYAEGESGKRTSVLYVAFKKPVYILFSSEDGFGKNFPTDLPVPLT